MLATSKTKYCAFISYSHHDASWAKWLQSRLESFRMDAALIARAQALGVSPKRLVPIFRDRDNFAPGRDLSTETREALDASAALIVVASPRSAISPYVNDEIRQFRYRHPLRPVIPVIIDGRNGSTEFEPFAPALRYVLDADGFITTVPIEILGADVRNSGDGRDLALAKVVSQLIGLPPEIVFGRIGRQHRRQNQLRAVAATVGVGLFLAAGISLSLYQQEQLRAEVEQNFKLAADSVATAREVDGVVANGADLKHVLLRLAAALPDKERGRVRPYVSDAEASLFRGLQAQKLRAILRGHSEEVTHIAGSNDRRWIATGSADTSARIWSTQDRRQVHVLRGHEAEVLYVAIDASDERLFTASADGDVGVWSAGDGKLIKMLKGHTADVTKLALSPDGLKLLSASVDGTAWIWDLSNYKGTRLQHLPFDWQSEIDANGQHRLRAIHPNTKRLVSSFYHPQRVRRFATKGLGVTDIMWAPDNQSVLTSGEDGRIVSWSLNGDHQFAIQTDSGPIYAMVVNFEKNTVTVGTDSLGAIWRLDTKSKLADLGLGPLTRPPSGRVPIIELKSLEDGRAVVGYVGARNSTTWGTYVWSTNTGEFLTRIRPPVTTAPVHAMDTRSDVPVLLDGVGTIETSASIRRQTENVLRLTIFGESDQITHRFSGADSPITAVLLGSDRQSLASGSKDGTVQLWSTHDRFIRDVLPVSDDPLVGVKSVAVANDGRTVAALNVAGELQYWLGPAGARKLFQTKVMNVLVERVAQGSAAESAGLRVGDRLLTLDGQVIRSMKEFVSLVEQSPNKGLHLRHERNGEILTANITPVRMNISDASGGQRTVGRVGLTGKNDNIPSRLFNAMHLSTDGRLLLAGARDGGLLAWNLDPTSSSVAPVAVRVGTHSTPIDALTVTSDGRLAISGARDGVRIFDLPNKREIRHIRLDVLRDAVDIHTSPTGSKFMVASSNNRAVVWDAEDNTFEFVLPPDLWETRFADFLADGTRLAVATRSHPRGFKIFDLSKKELSGSFTRDRASLTTHLGRLDANQVIEADNNLFIRLIDINTLAVVKQFDFFRTPVHALRATPDGKRIIAMGAGQFAIYDAGTGHRLMHQEAAAPPVMLEGSPVPDGALSAAASQNGRYVGNASRNLLFMYDVPETTQAVLNEFCLALPAEPTKMDGIANPCQASKTHDNFASIVGWAKNRLALVTTWMERNRRF